jgi:ferredoxin
MMNERKRGGTAKVIRLSCKGCHECLDVCPADAISFPDGGALIDPERCTGCGSCITVCRFDAIKL